MAADLSGPDDDVLDGLVARTDLDGLVRLVDERTTARDWAGLERVRDRCRAAVRTGRQLWPAATLAEYRLTLRAPAEWAARMIDQDSGHFAIGPLTEVVAQHHRWADLAPHLPDPLAAAVVAHERVLRGESLVGLDLPDVYELPLSLAAWEPAYCLPEYADDGSTFPSPDRPAGPGELVVPAPGAPTVVDPAVTDAARRLVEAWTAGSNGRADVVGVEGQRADALGALGLVRATVHPLSPGDALAWIQWAGASGGAHGRRPGGAQGRFGTWWLLAALGDLLDDWPLPAFEVGEVAASLRWWWWDAGEPPLGWELQLVVEDPVEGLAWALSARDAA